MGEVSIHQDENMTSMGLAARSGKLLGCLFGDISDLMEIPTCSARELFLLDMFRSGGSGARKT